MTRSSACRLHGSASAANARIAPYAPITIRRSPGLPLGGTCHVLRWRSEIEHPRESALHIQHVYGRVMLEATLGLANHDDVERAQELREITLILHTRESPRATVRAVVAGVFAKARGCVFRVERDAQERQLPVNVARPFCLLGTRDTLEGVAQQWTRQPTLRVHEVDDHRSSAVLLQCERPAILILEV